MKCLRCGKILNSPFCGCGYNHLEDKALFLNSPSRREISEIESFIGATTVPSPDGDGDGDIIITPPPAPDEGNPVGTTATVRKSHRLGRIIIPIVLILVFCIACFFIEKANNAAAPEPLSSVLSLTVRLKGDKVWNEDVQANIGDEVEYLIEYRNLLDQTVEDVMIRDVLPTNAEYVEGTTILYNSNHPDGVSLNDNTTVSTTGINIGSYDPKANAYVRFMVRIVDKTLADGDNQLINWASSTVNGKVVKDDASVFVSKTAE